MSRRKKTDGERIADWVFSGRYQARGMAFPSELAVEIDRLVRRRMAEARAEFERQARHIEELREKIDAERSCACSFDGAGDVCVAHSPALTRALAENARLRAQVAEYFREPATHPVEGT